MEKIRAGQYRYLVPKYRKQPPPDLLAAVDTTRQHTSQVNRRVLDIDAGLEPFAPPLNADQTAHLIKRMGFGATQSEIKQFTGQTAAQIVQSFVENRISFPVPVNNYNDPSQDIIDPEVPEGAEFVLAKFDNVVEGSRIVALKRWLITRILQSPGSLQEKMMLFWWNFLPIKMWDVFNAKFCYRYIKMLESHCFGNFKSLIRELTTDPAMLIFLSGAFNNKDTPDENFARELQELFCIGKGADAGYTEADVQAAARVLTGWTIDWESIHTTVPAQSFFDAQSHHTGDKIFSSFYGNTVIKGRMGQEGAQELEELLEMIFAHPTCAKHLARQLYRFFVSPDIRPSAEELVITPLAEIIFTNQYDITPALTALLGSAHFFHPEQQGRLIKNPLEYTLGYWRNFQMPLATNPQEEAELYTGLYWQISGLGLEMGDPPNVAGWSPYYQTPMYDRIWINTDTIIKRTTAIDSMLYWGYWLSPSLQVAADLIRYVEGLPNAEDPNALLAEVAAVHFGIALTPDQLSAAKRVLLNGQDQDYYWTGAWLTMQAEPQNNAARNVVLNRLRPTFQLLFQMAEAHLT